MAEKRTRADELLKDCENPEDVIGENGLLKQLTQKMLERALHGEMSHHLGYEKDSSAGINSGNSRNGSSKKKVKTTQGEHQVAVPRDRNGEFEPKILRKYQNRFQGFDDNIISLYARGMTDT